MITTHNSYCIYCNNFLAENISYRSDLHQECLMKYEFDLISEANALFQLGLIINSKFSVHSIENEPEFG